MKIIDPDQVKKVGVVGGGTIGIGWAAVFLASGYEVVVVDPCSDAESRMLHTIQNIWPYLVRLGVAPGASPDNITFTTDYNDLLSEVDFIQEAAPESESVKDAVIARVSELVRDDIIIASSTSGILPTRLQRHCHRPERMLVGHPFNPVYLMPLVEIVPGKQTANEVTEWARKFYRRCGKQPVVNRLELPGHIANRLQDAVRAEALQLIEDGFASTADIDAALTDGPGLRWSMIGTFLTGYLASPEGSFREVLEGKFGNHLYSNFQGPKASSALHEKIISETDAQRGSYSHQQMESLRDEYLTELIILRKKIGEKYNFESGSFNQ